MKKLILSLAFMLAAIVAFCQIADSTAVNSLIDAGVNKTISWVIVTVLGLAIAHFAVPNKWASVLVVVEKALLALYSVVHWFNLNTNRVSKKQETEKYKEMKSKKPLFKTLTVIVLLIVAGSASAQERWSGFFKPVDLNHYENTLMLSDTLSVTKSEAWLFRPSATLTAVAIDLKNGESQTLTSVGVGISYGKFSIVEDKPYCSYSFNALLLTSVKIGDEEGVKIGGAFTVDVFNKVIGLGIGYVANKPLLLTTISYSF